MQNTARKLTRRTVIAASGAAGAALLLDPSPWSASADELRPEPDLAAIRATQTAVARWLSPDMASLVELQVPVLADVSWPARWGSRILVTLKSDNRVISIGTRIGLMDRAHGPVIVPTEVRNSGTVVLGSATLALKESASGRSLQLMLPLEPREAYPFENLGAVEPTTIQLASVVDPRLKVELTVNPATLGTTAAWGAALYPGYTHLNVMNVDRSSAKYRFPASCRVMNVGPAAIPTGTTIDATLDARLFSDYRLTQLRVDDVDLLLPAQFVAAVQDELRLTIDFPRVRADAVVDLSFEATPRAEGIVVNEVRFSTVSLNSDPALATTHYRRATGRYVAVDLTSSGNPLSEGIAEGEV